MIKKIVFVIGFVILIFVFGIFLENKIRKDLSRINPSVSVETETSPLDRGDKEMAKVKRVVDGDTIELSDGRLVRYIGMNTPEMTDKRKDVLCFAKMAKEQNEKLVLNKTVKMEMDISDKDKYDRLLRYIWIDEKMVNLELVKSGYAAVATYPPDIKYKELFLEAKQTATKIICNTI